MKSKETAPWKYPSPTWEDDCSYQLSFKNNQSGIKNKSVMGFKNHSPQDAEVWDQNSVNPIIRISTDILLSSLNKSFSVPPTLEVLEMTGPPPDVEEVFRQEEQFDIDIDLNYYIEIHALVQNTIKKDTGIFKDLLTNLSVYLRNQIHHEEIAIRVSIPGQEEEYIRAQYIENSNSIHVPQRGPIRRINKFLIGHSEKTTNRKDENSGTYIPKKILGLLGNGIRTKVREGNEPGLLIDLSFEIIPQFNNGLIFEAPLRKPIFQSPGLSRLLLVEKDVVFRDQISEYLHTWGYNFDMASNSTEGCNLAKKLKYDLILTGIEQSTPGHCGIIKTMREDLNNIHKLTPIVALLSPDLRSAGGKFIQMGFSGFMVKPVSPQMLQFTLEKYILDRKQIGS